MNRKEAFKRASDAVSISVFGNSYAVYSPWKDVDGPRTSSSHHYYCMAVRYASAAKARVACELLGVHGEDIYEVEYEVQMNSGDWRQVVRKMLNRKGL